MKLRDLHKKAKDYEYKLTYDELKHELNKATLFGFIIGFLLCIAIDLIART